MFSNIMPLRAVIFQFLFLLIAIILEALVFQRVLKFDYRTSIQSAITINLLSTLIGWVVFFNVQSTLPEELKAQLISYLFFERFFPNAWFVGVAPILILVSLGMFMGTFFIKLKGLELLDIILEKNEKRNTSTDEKGGRFRGRKNQAVGFQSNSRAYAVLLANSISFSAILSLLLLRLLGQPQSSI